MNPFERPDDYTPQELMTGGGINTGLYNQWLYRNIFTATHPAEGPGTSSSYSFSDILTVALIVRLRRADIRLKKASSIAHDIVAGLGEWQQKNKSTDWPMAYVVFSDDGVQIDLEDKKRDMVLRMDIFTIIQNICGGIDGMYPE